MNESHPLHPLQFIPELNLGHVEAAVHSYLPENKILRPKCKPLKLQNDTFDER